MLTTFSFPKRINYFTSQISKFNTYIATIIMKECTSGMPFSVGEMTPLQVALGQSVSRICSVSFCSFFCIYVFVNLIFCFNNCAMPPNNHQLITKANSCERFFFLVVHISQSNLFIKAKTTIKQ